jgi:hypothetical protein
MNFQSLKYHRAQSRDAVRVRPGTILWHRPISLPLVLPKVKSIKRAKKSKGDQQ